MKKTLKLFFIISLLFVSGTGLFAQQKYALVIGNGNYTNIGKLNNPVNDANDMEAALQGLGFTVDKLLDANLDQMESAVMRLKNRLSVSSGSYGFFFYAGHGVQSNGENYLIPVGSNIPSENSLRDRAVSVQWALAELNEAKNALNVVVLDACRDNPFSWKRSGTRGLSVVGSQPVDSIIVYSTSAGSTAADGSGRNGLFTAHLLNNLKTPGLEVKEVFNRTGADVSRASNRTQIPAVYNQFFDTAYLGSKPQVTTTMTVTPQPTPVPSDMVRIQGGTFTMGSPANEPDRFRGEGPQHQVTVSGFNMGKYEVTQKEYQEVMGANPSYFKGDNLPVENVNWSDAVEYCNRRSLKEGLTPAYTINGDNVTWNRGANGYRLPTEAEWEYACRAGTTTPFSTGNNITTRQANYNGKYPYNNNAKGESRGKTTAVGIFSPNALGLYDMHGNVNEWCWDWFGDYTNETQTDPAGAVSGTARVMRGGCFYDGAMSVRSARREYGLQSDPSRTNGIGFRLVRP
ncbi:hypothetical protein R84B8_00298 [Treponema sp. R8-4-B8]